jgi:TRAP-type transport system periplasmic protein
MNIDILVPQLIIIRFSSVGYGGYVTMNRNKLRLLAIILLILLVVVGVNAAPKVTALSLGTINAASSADGKAAEKFKELVEAKSQGQIRIDIFHNSQLGPTMTQIESTMIGTQDILMAGMELYEKWSSNLKVLSLFYAFRDDAHFAKFFTSPIFAGIEKDLAAKNIKFINRKFNWVTGPYRVLMTTKPVNSLEDLKGMKLRMPEVETLQKSWTQLGAVPITITWSETYLALKQGMVQGLEAPLSIVRANKFQEVCKYITEVRTFPQRMGLTMNLDKLNSLSPELQTILLAAADEAGTYYSAIVEKGAKEDVDAMMSIEKVQYLKPDLAPWRAKMVPLIQELEKSGYMKKGLYDEIQNLK